MGKLRKLIASASVVAVLFSLVVTTSTASAGNWYDAYAEEAVTAGIINSVATLNADKPVTRAEGLKMLLKAFDLAEVEAGVMVADLPFTDVAGHWVTKEPSAGNSYLAIGVSLGAVATQGKTKFNPDMKMNRAEFAKMAVVLGGLPSCTGVTAASDLKADQWYYDYMLTAQCWSIIQGRPDGSADPDGTAVRAEAVTMAVRSLEPVLVEGAEAEGDITPPTPDGDDTPADDTPADDTPADDTPADDTPADDTVVGGGELMVSLSADSPGGETIPSNATSVEFAAFDFEAGDGGAIISSLTVHKTGVLALGTANLCYLYEGNNRLTGGKAVNTTTNNAAFNSLGYSVASGGTATLRFVCDVGDITASGDGQFEIVDAAAVIAGESTITGDFPVVANNFSVSTADVGTVTVVTNGDVPEPKVGEDDVTLAKFKISAATEDANLEKFGVYFGGGTASASEIQNCELYVSGQDDAVAMVESTNSKDVAMFVLDAPFAIEKGADLASYVTCDLNPTRSGDTIQAYIDESTDVVAIGATYGFGMAVTIADYDGATSCTAATPTDCTHSTVQGGDVTVTSSGPAATEIGINAKDVVLMDLTIATAGDVTFMDFPVSLDASETAASDGLLDATTANLTDIKIGCGESNETVWGPVDAGSLTTAVGGATAITEAAGDDLESFYVFSEDKVFAAGDEINCKLTADIRNLTTLADETIVASLEFSTTRPEIRDANNKILTNGTSLVPASNIVGKTMTIGSPSLTLSLGSTPIVGETQYVKGQTNVKFVGVSARCGSSSDCKVKDITITGDIDEEGDSNDFDDATLGADNSVNLNSIVGSVWLADSDGNVVAAAKPVQSTGAINFTSINWTIGAGDTELFYVIGTVSSNGFANSTNDDIAFGINTASDVKFEDESGTSRDGTGTVNPTNAADATGTNIVYAGIIGGGSVTIAVDSGTPNENLLVAGSADQQISKFKFTTTKEAFKIKKLSINAAQTAATTAALGNNDNNIATVKISYTNTAGTTETKTGSVVNGTAQFSGLDFYIAKDTDAVLTVNASLNEIIEGGGGSTAAEYVDLNLAFNNFEAVAQSSGDTYKGDKIDVTVNADSDLDFGTITWTDGTDIDINTAANISSATVGAVATLTVNNEADGNPPNLPVGTLLCQSADTTCAAEAIFVVTAWTEGVTFTDAGNTGDTVATLVLDNADTAVADADNLVYSLPGSGHLTTSNRMYIYKTLPTLAQGAGAPSGSRTVSPTDAIFQLAVTPNAKDDVIVRQGLEVDDETDPVETTMDDAEVVVGATLGTQVIDGTNGLVYTAATLADEDCFLFDRTFTAGTGVGALGSNKYLSFWINSDQTDVTFDAIQVIGDDNNACAAGGDDQILLTSANTWIDGTLLVDPAGGQGGGQVINGTANQWRLVTVDLQQAGNTIDATNNTFIGISIETTSTTTLANGDVVRFDGAVLHNEALFVDLAANAVLDTTPSTVVDCTLKKGTSVIATADVAVQTTSQARLFIVPQDNEAGTDYVDILMTKGVANSYDLVCDTQALITQSTNEDLLTPSIDYGSSVDGTVTRGDFYWSADETTRTLVYWLGNVGTKLTGNTLKY